MEVVLGKNAGFCYGVRRAVDGAKDELKKANNKIYCLGEIVHNKQVVNKLRENGMKFIEQIEETNGSTVIRAHGVKKQVYEYGKKHGIELKDFTCPYVLRIHNIAEEYAENGYYIFLCGSKKHPENIGTISFCGKYVSVIETEEDTIPAIEEFKKSGKNKLLVIIQTTYSVERFNKIEKILKEKMPEQSEVVIKNTICKATEVRQQETDEISKNVEYMVIVGGANSSNTKKLYEIGKKNCNNCICIETAEELPIQEIKNYNKVGVMAGASTPQEVIQNVVDKLNNI